MARGVDIYRYQTVTNYQTLARAVRYVWVKLTDGLNTAQVPGDRQVNGCRAAGIPVGGYHYAQKGDPIRQARKFAGELRRLKALDITPALDLEAPFSPNNEARDFAVTFLRELTNGTGWRPAVYMSASWAAALRPDRWGIPGLVIWIAAYGSNDGGRRAEDVTRYYSGRYDVHQHTSSARVAGISGAVDLNWALTGVPVNSTKEEDDMQLTDRVDWDKINSLGPNTPGHKILSTWQNVLAIRQMVTAQTATIGKLAELLAEGRDDLTAEEIKAAVSEAIGDKINVDLNIDVDGSVSGQPSAGPVLQ